MKQYNNIAIEKSILEVIRYFKFFNYPPSLEEIYTFLKKKTSKRQITGILEKLEKRSLIKVIFNDQFSIYNEFSMFKNINFENLDLIENLKLKIVNSIKDKRYTLGEYKKSHPNNIKQINVSMKQWSNRQQISVNKLNSLKFRFYLKILHLFPQIKLVGLSGSVAMLNAEEDHDIDLFIITAKNRLWTGRFVAILLAKILGIHRSYYHKSNETVKQFNNFVQNKVCLNLFFDQSNLDIPGKKRSPYVAHEVLQMQPLIDRERTYLSFIDTNRWVFDIFPNSSSKFLPADRQVKIQNSKLQLKTQNFSLLAPIFNFSFLIFNLIAEGIESLLKKIQMSIIAKHRTSELITDQQLWFHPDDFEKKIKI